MRTLVLAGLAAVVSLHQAPAVAAASEAQVKAAYIYKLASFVRWPGDAPESGEFRLCVSGRRDVAAALNDLVRGQRVAALPIAVHELDGRSGDLARSCRVLFLGRAGDAAGQLMEATNTVPVLTICDRNSGTRGCIIDFMMRDGRVRFALDRARADRRRLELSAKLMDVAVDGK